MSVLPAFAASFAILAEPAHAYYFHSGSSDNESEQLLTVGSGISAPSLTSSQGGNPSGLIFNESAKLVGGLATGRDGSGLMGNSLRILTGNGSVGAGIGVETFNNTSDGSGSITYFNFGLATYADSIQSTFGINGNYRIARRGSIGGPDEEKTWTGNLGYLYNPYGDVRLGVTLFDLSHNIQAYGAGLAVRVNERSLVALDLSANRDGGAVTAKPGIGVNASPFQLTYSYGVRFTDGQSNAGMSIGNTIGLGLEFSSSVRLEAYYNQYSLYSLGAVMRF